MDLSKQVSFQDAIVTVMGLGRYGQGGGLSATKWLLKHGSQIVITDLKDAAELKESVDSVMEWFNKYREQFPDRTIYQPLFILGTHRPEDFLSVDCVVQSPGVQSEVEFALQAKAKGVAMESDVSLFFRYFQYPTIAVTGTRGKTTTTRLLGAMLKRMDESAVIAGNIVMSPLEVLDDLVAKKTATPVVIELSSWILESLPSAFADMKKGPDIAVITNVFPDHLSRYQDFEAYIASKEIMITEQTPEQFAVLNYDNEPLRKLAEKVTGKLFWCSETYQDHDGCYVKEGQVVFRKAGVDAKILPVVELGLQSAENLENVLTATCAALLRGVKEADVAQTLRKFVGASEAQELVREVNDITFINDTVAVTPGATIDVLKKFGVHNGVVLIAGGEDQHVDYKELIEEIVKSCKQVILLPGTASDSFETMLLGKVETERALDMADAVTKARAVAIRGTVVLLSPAAPGAPLFANEFVRGEQFRDAVRTL
jgi:UDP-N-acetylmuramoylalanine--D-glutamate ligase